MTRATYNSRWPSSCMCGGIFADWTGRAAGQKTPSIGSRHPSAGVAASHRAPAGEESPLAGGRARFTLREQRRSSAASPPWASSRASRVESGVDRPLHRRSRASIVRSIAVQAAREGATA